MLETPSIRRYSCVSHPRNRVVACAVKNRPVRTISRKGSAHQPGWTRSHPTSVITWQGSSMEKGASTSLFVENGIGRCRGAFRYRSMCRRSARKLLSFCERSSIPGQCGAVATASSTSRSRSQRNLKSGCSPSSSAFRFVVRSSMTCDLSQDHEARPGRTSPVDRGNRGDPHSEGTDEPWRQTTTKRCGDHRRDETRILRGHTRSSLVEAEG